MTGSKSPPPDAARAGSQGALDHVLQRAHQLLGTVLDDGALVLGVHDAQVGVYLDGQVVDHLVVNLDVEYQQREHILARRVVPDRERVEDVAQRQQRDAKSSSRYVAIRLRTLTTARCATARSPSGA